MDAVESLARTQNSDPSELLYLLRYGAWAEGRCAPATRFASTRWVRLDALPAVDDDESGPFENLLTAVINASTTVEVVLDHDDDGLAVYLGSEADVVKRGRRIIAPGVDPQPCTAPPPMTGWHELGLVFRLLNDNSAAHHPRTGGTRLLQRLGALDGRWRLTWRLTGSNLGDLDDVTGRIEHVEELAAQRKTSTRQTSTTSSTSASSSSWSRIERWLSQLHDHLALGRSIGLWQVTTHALSPDTPALESVIAACRAALPVTAARIFATDVCGVGSSADPAPTSVLTTAEVASILASPATTIPGLRVHKSMPSGRRMVRGAVLPIGQFWGTDIPCELALDDLEGHAFIAGTTGAGKTATVTRILAEAWNRHGIPCLILDPVKDDYAQSAKCFRGGLTVVRGSTLCMNMLAPWPGTAAEVHVSRVSQAFRGSFSMPSPAPYVVMQMFDSLLTARGGVGDAANLSDLRDSLDGLVQQLGYAAENTANIRAAVMTRLNLLLAPHRAHRFVWPDSTYLLDLMTKPTVVTLSDLGDDEERSFVVLLLAMAVWSAAKCRPSPAPIEHLLVLEEAHRVIPEVGPGLPNDENGSARRESSGLLVSMLAEVRSFGEQVLIVDQSPAKVASDVVRNTNLKVVHRIVHPEDQQQLGGSIGLDEDDYSALGSLQRGQVVVSTRTEPAPQLARIGLAPPLGVRGATEQSQPPVPWPCCTPAGVPASHFLAWQKAGAAAQYLALFLVGVRFGDGDGAKLRQYVFQSLLRQTSIRDLNRECLAWAGIRHVLSAERALGFFKSPNAFEASVDSSYAAWASKEPAAATLAREVRLDAGGYLARCDMCDEMCGVRVPAQLWLAGRTRTGLRSLSTITRREALPAIEHAVARELDVLTVLLGPDAAWRLQRCQIAQAVHHAQLDRSVRVEIEDNVKKLLSSAGGATP
ncbi:ATP-binding protein [Mycobacterium sp. NPDC050041]|uniref:ATP-binding protein n=1 Tax=Mycobacterium sp. NPDC050041 TaxID=3364293 RepID=UPI003C2B8B15